MTTDSNGRSLSDRLRDVLTSGRQVNLIAASKEVGATGSLGGVLIRELEVLGYRFDRTVVNGQALHRCTNSYFRPSEEDQERLRAKKRAASARRRAQAAGPSRTRIRTSEEIDRNAPPGETAIERKRRLDREYKQRKREQEIATSTTNTAVAHSAEPEAPSREVEHQPVHTFEHFNGAGILGVDGFGREGPMRYVTKVDGTPPTLGQGLQVFAMALLDNGVMRLGVQSGDRRWVADVVAEVER